MNTTPINIICETIVSIVEYMHNQSTRTKIGNFVMVIKPDSWKE